MIGRTNSGTGGGKRKHQFYGVAWDRSSNTALSRLGDAADFTNPIAAVGNGSGSSPFDKIMPWKGMNEFNIIDGAVAYEKGVDAEFSRTLYDTVVRIPKFYYKVVNGANWELWITPEPYEGFSPHPAFEGKDYIYVGKYYTGSSYITKSGYSPIVSMTRATFRTNARNKGANWDMFNFMVRSAICMLYLVEFADWNSQSAIGNGYTDASAKTATGGTDSITYHTGRGTGTNSQIKYREIEDLWGNVWCLCDGMNFNGLTPYYCTDRTKFADSTSTNYTACSFTVPNSTDTYQKSIGHDTKATWLILNNSGGGSSSTYIPDGSWCTNSGWKICDLFGRYNDKTRAGLFAMDGSIPSNQTYDNFSSRLIWIPS